MACEMVHHPIEHGWTSPRAGEKFRTTLRAKPRDRLRDSNASDVLIPLRPTIQLSGPAMLAALLSICLLGAGGLLWMHSQVRGPSSTSPALAVAEPQAAAVPPATTTDTSPIPTPTLTPTALISTAAPVAGLASARPAVAAPLHRSRLKPTPHVRLYPFPVPTPPAVTMTPSAPADRPLPAEPNPYDVPSETPSDNQE
jgi:hypothetical protein